jgi:hypothetical protein
LADCLSDIPSWVVGDKGYASHAFRQFIWDQGARPAIPAKSNEAPVAYPSWIYNNRNRVERLWARLKEWRTVATRYEKTAKFFTGVPSLAAVFDWIRHDIKPQQDLRTSIAVQAAAAEDTEVEMPYHPNEKSSFTLL